METKAKRRSVKNVSKLKSVPVDVKATREQLSGVDFDLIKGAQCPKCRMHLKKIPGKTTTNVLPWADGVRVRYHTCRRCGAKFKSIETKK